MGLRPRARGAPLLLTILSRRVYSLLIFEAFLDSIIMSSAPLLVVGNFNIHLDVPGNADSVCLKELL